MAPVDLVIDGLATYRLTRLLTTDRAGRPIRQAVEDRYGPTGLGYLVTCDWCSSIYAGMLVVTARTLAPRLWDPVAKALAFSAVTGLIAEHA